MPTSTHAALVFLIIVVPGFLAMAGYRLGRAVPDHADGLVLTAQVIAISTFIAVFGWRLGGQDLYRHAQRGTALTDHEPQTYRFVVAMLIVPGVAGFAIGQAIDWITHRVWSARRALPPFPAPGAPREEYRLRIRRGALTTLSARLLHDGPTTWDRTWKQIRRGEPYVYVRVTTTGGRVIVGTVADESRIALSPQPRDLFIEQTLREAPDGHFYPTAHGLGAFVSGSEIETVEWVSKNGVMINGRAANDTDH